MEATNIISDLIDRYDSELAAWAIRWMDIDLPAEWESLDDDERDRRVNAAISKMAYYAHDLPAGLECGMEGAGLYVQPEEEGDDARYHLDADQCTRVIRFGWSAVMPDIVDALGVRATLDGARQWQVDMDEVIDETDPWVKLDDSLAAGNCRPETDRFYERLKSELDAGEIGAVRASVILSLRDDAYTRRTCRVAAARGRKARWPTTA